MRPKILFNIFSALLGGLASITLLINSGEVCAEISDFNVKIHFSGYSDGRSINWKGQVDPDWSVNIKEVIEGGVLAVAREKFSHVESTNDPIVKDSDLVIGINISELTIDVSTTFFPSAVIYKANYLLTISAESGSGKKWGKPIRIEAECQSGPYENQEQSRRTNKECLTKLYQSHVPKAFKTFIDNSETVAFISEGDRVRSLELENLQPYMATYRVFDAQSTIRKSPNPKSGVVRKVGIGSILQIIGKLPTGWLQVGKEGEAIGWIHEDSVTALSTQPQSQPTIVAVAPVQAPVGPASVSTGEAFPTKPVSVSFRRAKPSPDDIAVIIGNANYKATAKDIPDVVPAYADAEGMRQYAVQALGIKEENVIFIKDAKLKDLVATFGTDNNPKGKLWNWVKPQASNVFIYYSGHGAPSGDGGNTFLVPTDAEASLIDLSGYSLKTLYTNLGKLPAKSVTVVLEACFSGATQDGMIVKNASPIYQKATQEVVPSNLTVISAGSGNQIASWEQDKSQGLFTKYFLLGMAGAADKKPYGNGDGKVTTDELTAFLKGTMSYSAQRYYGREQTVQIMVGGK